MDNPKPRKIPHPTDNLKPPYAAIVREIDAFHEKISEMWAGIDCSFSHEIETREMDPVDGWYAFACGLAHRLTIRFGEDAFIDPPARGGKPSGPVPFEGEKVPRH